MANLKQSIEVTLFDANRLANVEETLQKTASLVKQSLIKTTSKVGHDLEQAVAGFQPLTQSVDDVVSSVAGSAPIQTTGNIDVVQLTSNVTGLSNQLVKDASEVRSSLENILDESLAADGFLDVVVSAPFPDAMAAALKEAVPDVTVTQLKTVANEIVDLAQPLTVDVRNAATALVNGIDDFEQVQAGLESMLNNIVDDAIGGANIETLKTAVNSLVNSSAASILGDLENGFASVIENAVEKTLKPAAGALSALTIVGDKRLIIPQNDLIQIIRLVQADDLNNAVNIVRRYSEASDQDIINVLKQIDNRASTQTNRSTNGVDISTRDLNSLKNLWAEASTPTEYFSNNLILDPTFAEVTSEFANINREVTEIIIWSSLTGNDIDITALDFQQAAIEETGKGTAVHYLITRSGLVERGRPVDIETPPGPSLPNNHHQRSINLVMVGGVNAPEPKENSDIDISAFYSDKSYTQAQWTSLEKFLRSAFTALPGLQVLGASDINTQHPDPCFDVIEYVKAKFGKESLFEDPLTQSPFTRADLANNVRR